MSAWILSRKHIDAIITTSVKGFRTVKNGPLTRTIEDGQWTPERPSYFIGEVLTWEDQVGRAPLTEAEATAMGQVLWNANYRSVNARYGESRRAPRYAFTGNGRILTLAELAKAIHCLDYQSCEYPEWYTSKARKFLDKVEQNIYRVVAHDLPGYDEAPWGID